MFHTANCTGELCTRNVIAEQCPKLRIVGSCERILGGSDFDVVGYAGLKSSLRKCDFLIGQLQFLPAKVNLVKSRWQFDLSITYLLGYAFRSCGELFLRPLLCQCGALPLSTEAPAGEDGDSHAHVDIRIQESAW